MKLEGKFDIYTIGKTVRAVAQAQSSRLFKSEVNSPERSAVVSLVIRSEVALALYDLGLPLHSVMVDINPTDDVLARMIQDGYKFSVEQLKGGLDV